SNSQMADQDIETTLDALRELNKGHRALRDQAQTAETLDRLATLTDSKEFGRVVTERIRDLRRRAAELRATNPDRAAQLEADVARLQRLARARGDLTDLTEFEAEVAKSSALKRHLQGGEDQLRRL